MFFSKNKLSLCMLLLASPALACGPFFPATIINSSDALLTAPFVHLAASLQKIPQPAVEFRAVRTAKNQSLSDLTLTAEFADLRAAGVPAATLARHEVRRRALAELEPAFPTRAVPPELRTTEGLPTEFALYHNAVVAILNQRPALATATLTALLALPPEERRYKSTWAAFTLARLHEDNAPTEARRYFQQVRELARAGFADTLGLAASSLGWEAKTHYDRADYVPAARLYLGQFATGDDTAVNSLRFLVARLFEPSASGQLAAFAADARLRALPTAVLVSNRENRFDASFDARAATRWLAALEEARVRDDSQATPLALAAYRAGDIPACERWLRFAPADDDLALWLRAKLAIRDGRVEDAAAALSRLVRRSTAADGSLGTLAVSYDSEYAPLPAPAHLRAELAVLKLASRDYAEALDLLLEGGRWEDAAYVAERVLTVDELKAFVATHPEPTTPALPASAEVDEEYRPREPRRSLRHLLARRLVRHHRLTEARAYFPEKFAPIFDRFSTLLTAGRDRAQPSAVRSAALMEAARLLRREGMELRGTELGPDYAIWDGNFEAGVTLASREALPSPYGATRDEHWRASAREAGQGQRFHYRYLAADLAWEAIALMPDETDATARALIEAGGWLKNRDARAANPFYQALVKRCGTTALGRTAAEKRWFPAVPP